MTVDATSKPRARTFVLDNVVVLVATVLTKLRGLLTLPLLIKGLGTDAYGVWSLILATSMVLSTVVGLNLHHALVQLVSSEPRRANVFYGSLLSASLLCAGVPLLLLGLLAPGWARELAVGTADARYLWVALGLTLANTVRTLNSNLYRATNRLRARTVFDLSSSLLELIGILTLLAAGRSLLEVLMFMIAMSTAFVVATTLHSAISVGIGRPERTIIVNAIRYGVPLIPAGLGAFALDRGDRFVISRFLGEHDVGIYSAQCAIGSLISMLILPLQTTLVPRVTQLWKTHPDTAKSYLSISFRLLAAVSALFVAGVAVLSPALFRRIANPEIAASAALNVSLVAVGFCFYGFTIVEMTVPLAARRTKAVGVVMGAGAALNFALNWVAVPHFGIVASAAATAATYAFTFGCLAILNRRVFRFRHDVRSVLRSMLAALVAALLMRWLAPTRMPVIVAAAAAGTTAFAILFVASGGLSRDERTFVASRAQLLWARLARRAT